MSPTNPGEPVGLVSTIKERCRKCYTCVRECRAKAIRIHAGQAEVVVERCIGCGNCVRVCSQHAKRVRDGLTPTRDLLKSGRCVIAAVAPSFPAEFCHGDSEPYSGLDYCTLVGMIRALGFTKVIQVAYGADLVARKYRELLETYPDRNFISTTCPSIILYVEKYHPDLVPYLAPVVSPMIATARVAHKIYGDDALVVFIGPCIAKKDEAATERYSRDMAAALTFVELRQMFRESGITTESVRPTDFDPPYPDKGMLFSIKRGILQAAGIKEDLINDDVIVADGGSEFGHALREFESKHLNARLLEVLSCKGGCIMGAGTATHATLFSRRSEVSRYVRRRLRSGEERLLNPPGADDIDLNAWFYPDDRTMPVPSEGEIQAIMEEMGKRTHEDELNCGACGYETCREHAIAIFDGLAETEMCLPTTIARLGEVVLELNTTNQQLASAQQALVQSEKLASMGQLAAGIAHEVNNPLGVVLLYSQLLLEECNPKSELYNDLKKIAEQSDRCKKIVSGLLNFARNNQVQLKQVHLGDFVQSCVRAVIVPDDVKIKVESRLKDPVTELDQDQMMQVFTNLMNNSIEAMPGKGTLVITADGDDAWVQVSVSDNGNGIPKEHQKKIFEPFFTTKTGGKGTGLGLAITYGIVKMHRGNIAVQSNADPKNGPTGTTITVKLPRNPGNAA